MRKYMNWKTLLIMAAVGLCTGCSGKSVNDTDKAAKELTTQAVSQGTEAAQEETTQKSGYTVELNADNQWDAGDARIGAQCDIIFHNNTGTDITDWKLEIAVSDSLKVESLWNGEYALKDGILTITPADYNQTIAVNTEIPIGFIMNGDQVPDAGDITYYIDGVKYQNTIQALQDQDTTQDPTTEDDTTQENTVSENTDAKSGKTPLDTYGKLSVKGTKLVDASGNPVQLTGVSTHGLAWFPQYVNLDAFLSLRDTFGVNVIRLAMYTDENGGYCTDGSKSDLEKKIDEAVQATKELGMYVIIDWHVLHDLTPLKYEDEAKTFFSRMSKKYASYDNVIYEICNEPNGGTGWAEVKQYAEDIIPVIRANAKDAIIIIGTPNWSQDVDEAAKDPVSEYDNLMYAVHFYAATHKEDLRNKVKNAIDAGLPLIISEFSICDASGNGGIDYDSADAWMKLADKYQLSFIGWSLSNKAETASILNPDCKKTSGFSEEDLSESGKWLMQQIQKRH